MAVTVVSWKKDGLPLGQVTEIAKKKWEEAQDSQAPSNFTKVYYPVDIPPQTPPLAPEALALSRDKALAYVNTARVALGHPALDELPRGHRAVPSDCVIARAIPGIEGVGGSISFRYEGDAEKVAAAWAITRQGKVMHTPLVLANFIREFDHCQHPALFV